MGATQIVTVSAGARTAVRPVDGELAGWNPVVLAGVVGREVLERAGLDAGVLDEVVVGCCDPVGAAGADVARAVVLAAGWPVSIGGSVVDRGETSGAAAVQAAVAAIRAGQARTVLVVGLGLCSVVPPGAAALNRTYGAPWGGVAERFEEVGGLLPAPRLSERAAQAAGIGRTELDAAAEECRRRRAEAETSPAIVAVAARPGDAAGRGVYRGDPVATDVVRDWGDAAELPPAFDDDGLLTAATFAPPADCVTAVLLQAGFEAQAPDGTTTMAESETPDGTTTMAESETPDGTTTVAGMGRAAGDPSDPVGNVAVAVGRALDDAGVELAAVEAISVVEHDAATALLVARALDIDAERINRDGGAVATGNAGAAEELRLITDGLAVTGGQRLLLTISAGPTGSATIVWQTDI
ncbi:MAG: hypothetical protein F4126_11715 [Acidimicrobiaceae bacterium]|nr:hypothetical protein [Acidimicrobiaceae bacterium]MYB86374.1 hypothetical protein [Acidimicrobiaceae bacterium]MYH94366.1 hypothetical protein [Acidimicrobiaceae bacterium]